MFKLVKKRKSDEWNEKAELLGEVMEVEADEFVDNIAHNSEGVSAEKTKWVRNQTTTPKMLQPNKRS